MWELPLFPLNTVLFPGMPIALHIFEERYKEMIGACLAQRKPFGVVLIRRGVAEHGPIAETYSIGCSADITEHERLPQGRLNITAMGRERFRIVRVQHKESYLVGQVESYSFADQALDQLLPLSARLHPWLRRYLEVLASAGNFELDEQQLPNEPIALAYLGAILLQIPTDQKQALLEIDSAAALLSALRHTYRREVALLRAMLSRPRQHEGPFTSN